MDILDSGSLKIQYNRNRYYDYYTGRWLTHDPLGITPNAQWPNGFGIIGQYKDGINLYEYASSNPFDTVEPSGLLATPYILRKILIAIFFYCTDLRGVLPVARLTLGSEILLARCGTGLPRLTVEVFIGGAGYPYGHCVWSCEIAKKHGRVAASSPKDLGMVESPQRLYIMDSHNVICCTAGLSETPAASARLSEPNSLLYLLAKSIIILISRNNVCSLREQIEPMICYICSEAIGHVVEAPTTKENSYDE